jgi:hypothetical protein
MSHGSNVTKFSNLVGPPSHMRSATEANVIMWSLNAFLSVFMFMRNVGLYSVVCKVLFDFHVRMMPPRMSEVQVQWPHLLDLYTDVWVGSGLTFFI